MRLRASSQRATLREPGDRSIFRGWRSTLVASAFSAAIFASVLLSVSVNMHAEYNAHSLAQRQHAKPAIDAIERHFRPRWSPLQAADCAVIEPADGTAASFAPELRICDYGAATGGNSFAPVASAVQAARKLFDTSGGAIESAIAAKPSFIVRLMLNDAPSNSWGKCAEAARSFPTRLASADAQVDVRLRIEFVKRSFYESLVSYDAASFACLAFDSEGEEAAAPPSGSAGGVIDIDLGVCLIAAHWLSSVPSPDDRPGRHGAFVANELPPGHPVREAWRAHAHADLSRFLMLRSAEIRAGGLLILALPGSVDDARSGTSGSVDASGGRAAGGDWVARQAWPALRRILQELATSGVLTQTEADAVTTRQYYRSRDDVLHVLEQPCASACWDILQFDAAVRQPCPYTAALADSLAAGGEAAAVVPVEAKAAAGAAVAGAFRGFLESCVKEGLQHAGRSAEAAAAGADAFWAAVQAAAAADPLAFNLHSVVHYLVLQRKGEPAVGAVARADGSATLTP